MVTESLTTAAPGGEAAVSAEDTTRTDLTS